MTRANIHDRRSIEQVYPVENFTSDAAVNDKQPANPILKGVRISSAPDKDGCFELEPASQQVGEVSGAVFLPAFRRDAGDSDYNAFVGEIIEAAQRSGFRRSTAPGPGDPRLRGLRQ